MKSWKSIIQNTNSIKEEIKMYWQPVLYKAKEKETNKWVYGYYYNVPQDTTGLMRRVKHYIATEEDGSKEIDFDTLCIKTTVSAVDLKGHDCNAFSDDIVIASYCFDNLKVYYDKLGIINYEDHDIYNFTIEHPNYPTDAFSTAHWMPKNWLNPMVTVIGNMHDIDINLSQLRTIEEQTRWINKNVKGTGSKKRKLKWERAFFSEQEMTIIYVFDDAAKNLSRIYMGREDLHPKTYKDINDNSVCKALSDLHVINDEISFNHIIRDYYVYKLEKILGKSITPVEYDKDKEIDEGNNECVEYLRKTESIISYLAPTLPSELDKKVQDIKKGTLSLKNIVY